MTQNPLIFSFEKVQRIPYRLCEYLPDKIDENLSFGSCLHKSDLLLKLLQKLLRLLGLIHQYLDPQ